MNYKMLAIDMDGTFLNEDRNISENNLKAVREAAKAGVKVVVCSGRTPALLKAIRKDLPKNQPVIAGNGSIILDHNDKELFYEAIDKNTMFKIVDILRDGYDHVYYHYFDGEAICSEKFQDVIEKFSKMNSSFPREQRVELRIIPDTKSYIVKNNSKISKIDVFYNDPETIIALREKLRTIQEIEVVSAGVDGLEITKRGFNKGSSLEILAKHYGFALSECIAVGNDENDMEMIRRAGLGVAVKNAKDIIKEVANYVTKNDNDNDAVAEVVYKFINPAV